MYGITPAKSLLEELAQEQQVILTGLMTFQLEEDNRGKIPLDGIAEADINRLCMERQILSQHILLSTLLGRGAETVKYTIPARAWEQAETVLL